MTAAVTLAAAVVLTCAALYLEYCCRVPDPPDRDRSRRGRPPALTAGTAICPVRSRTGDLQVLIPKRVQPNGPWLR